MTLIAIPIKSCVPLHKSVYNSNYFQLPIKIDGSDELHIISNDDANDSYFINGKHFGGYFGDGRNQEYYELDTEDSDKNYT